MEHKIFSFVEKSIDSQILRDIIFNFDCPNFDEPDSDDQRFEEFLTAEDSYIYYLENVLILTFFIIYKAFLIHRQQLIEEGFSHKDNAFIRIYNLLDSILNDGQITFEKIDSLFVLIQMDANSSFLFSIGLKNFINEKDTELKKYVYELKKCKISARRQSNFGLKDLQHALNIFTYLKNCSASYYNYFEKENIKSLKITNTYTDEEFKLDDLLLIINHCNVVSLNNFSLKESAPRKDQILKLEYISFSHSSDVFAIHCLDVPMNNLKKENYEVIKPSIIENFLLRYNCYSNVFYKNKTFIKDNVLTTNIYIKTLAQVLSDVISMDTKKEIIVSFSDYKDVFENNFRYDFDNKNYRWDEILTFLFLEVGVYKVLDVILRKEPYNTLTSAFKNLNSEQFEYLRKKHFVIDDPTVNLSSKNDENTRACQIEALILLATQMIADTSFGYSKKYIPETIGDIINEISKNEKTEDSETIKKLISRNFRKLIKVVNFLWLYFESLLAYANKRRTLELDNTYLNSINTIDFETQKIKCLEVFTQKKLELKKNSFLKFNVSKIDDFTNDMPKFYDAVQSRIEFEFNNLIKCSEDFQKKNTSKNELIQFIYGKSEILNISIVKNYKDQIISTIQSFINNEKNNNLKEQYQQLRFIILKFLNYLKCGHDYMDNDVQTLDDAIYPLIITCTSEVFSRDGYKYASIQISDDERWENNEIKVISDNDFSFGETYFCIPHKNRIMEIKKDENPQQIDKNILINPVLIPYEAFDPAINAKFGLLQDTNEDFQTASELLYETDRHIYANLFGSLENAKKVFPILFNAEDSIFNKKYIYVLKQDEKIICVATFYNTNPLFDESVISSSFRQAGVTKPETYEYAINYLKDTFRISYSNYYFICDLVVASEKRGLGFGKVMLFRLNKIAKKDFLPIIITVYKDNKIALSLYRSMGYEIGNVDSDNRGTKNSTYQYFTLIKNDYRNKL